MAYLIPGSLRQWDPKGGVPKRRWEGSMYVVCEQVIGLGNDKSCNINNLIISLSGIQEGDCYA
jgi:hypothetical protein